MTGSPLLAQYIIAGATTAAEGTLLFLFAPYLDSYGYALPAIGALLALVNVARLCSRVPIGAAYRPARARRQLALWLVVFGAATTGLALANGWLPFVLVLAAIGGFAFGATGTLNLAIVIDITEGRRAGSTMGWYTAFVSAGYALGFIAGGAVADAAGVQVAMAVMGFLPVGAVLLTLTVPSPAHPSRALERAAGLRGLWRAHRDLDVRVWLAFLVVLYINLVTYATDTFFPLFGLALGIPLATTGVLSGFRSAGATLIRFAAGVVFRYIDHRAVNLWGVLALGAAMFCIPFVGASVLALGALMLVSGLCRGLLRVTSAAMIADLRAEGRDVGVASGVYNAGLDIGGILGPALAGVLAQGLGIPAMFQVVALGSVAAYLAVALSTARARGALGFGDPRVRRVA